MTRRHFILPGLLVPVLEGTAAAASSAGHLTPLGIEHSAKESLYKKVFGALPNNYRIVRLDDGTRLHVGFHGVDRGNLMVSATGLRAAYNVAHAVVGYLALVDGHTGTGHTDALLYELASVPRARWSVAEFTQALRPQRGGYPGPSEYDFVSSGRFLFPNLLCALGANVAAVASDAWLGRTLRNLSLSRYLFNGFMAGSYYHSHYKPDRAGMTVKDLERRYLEDRERYELAFVSAFKAVESLLHTAQIKKNKVDELLDSCYPNQIASTTQYRRYHEVFSGHPESTTYSEMVKHFLDIRNTVAAHSNPSPPLKFVLCEDSIFEIQNFVGDLYARAMKGRATTSVLPNRAFLKRGSSYRGTSLIELT